MSHFQRIIQEIIQKYQLQGTFAYLDNITVVGANEEDHDRNLNALLKAAAKSNFTFNESKSIIAKSEIDLLGYRVSHSVIRPDPERLKPLMNVQLPTCKSVLRRLVGMFAYYARWNPQFSERIRPLNLAITCNDFPLSKESAEAFESLKETFLNCCLSYIRDDVFFQVDCDASEHSVAATLSQKGRAVAFFSKTLNKSEKVYPVVEKEALAIMEAVRRWSHYLYGKCFDLVIDQCALSFMLDKTSKGKVKNRKIQLCRDELGCFDYRIHHRPGKLNVVLDSLSRIRVAASTYSCDLEDIHKKLGHPGIIMSALKIFHFL